MATATVTLTLYPYPKGSTTDRTTQTIRGTAAVQASTATYATGGLSVVWTMEALKVITYLPIDARFVGTSGYTYVFNVVTNKLQIFQVPNSSSLAGDSPLIELQNATTIPVLVSSDVIAFSATFERER